LTRSDELVTVTADDVGEYVPSRTCRLDRLHSRTLSHTPALTRKIFSTAAIDKVDRHLKKGFDTAARLFRQNTYEQCIDALRELLADPVIPRYHHMRCLTLLSDTLGGWDKAHSSYVKAGTIRRITKRWHCAKEPLDDLHDYVDELKYISSVS
jgi:hypothetical protein